jgi:hypothetical protein
MGDLLDATEASVRAATHLTDMDAGAVEAIRALAVKIDVMDEYFDALASDHAERRLRPPSQDNVSIPTYLKYAEALGLTPSGRVKAAGPQTPAGGAAGGKSGGTLGKLQGIAGGRAS